MNNSAPVTFFDVISAMRDRRELRFVFPNGSEVVAVPFEIHINSRINRHFWGILVGGTEFTWDEANTGAGGVGIIHEL